MGRLVDENDVYNVLTKYYHHKTATQHVALIDALGTAKTVDAIPVEWLEAKMKSLVSPGCKDVVDWLLAEWREEQNGKSNQC